MSSKVYSAVVAGIDAFEVEISKSLFVLVVATSLVALMSEFLVGAVEAAQRGWDLPKSLSVSL